MDLVKADSKNAVDILLGLLQKIWEEKKYEWRNGHIGKLPKKGDVSEKPEGAFNCCPSQVKYLHALS